MISILGNLWSINGRLPIFCRIVSSSEAFGRLAIFAIENCVYWEDFGSFLVYFSFTSHFLTKCLFFVSFSPTDGLGLSTVVLIGILNNYKITCVLRVNRIGHLKSSFLSRPDQISMPVRRRNLR
jgi:hypothetical protein